MKLRFPLFHSLVCVCKNGGQEALDRAKENILKHYAVVGLLEYFQLTFKICQKRFPYFMPVFPRDPASLRVNQGMKSKARKERTREMRFFAASPLSFAAPPLMREIGKREPARHPRPQSLQFSWSAGLRDVTFKKTG